MKTFATLADTQSGDKIWVVHDTKGIRINDSMIGQAVGRFHFVARCGEFIDLRELDPNDCCMPVLKKPRELMRTTCAECRTMKNRP